MVLGFVSMYVVCSVVVGVWGVVIFVCDTYSWRSSFMGSVCVCLCLLCTQLLF